MSTVFLADLLAEVTEVLLLVGAAAQCGVQLQLVENNQNKVL
jgi:hypothetical protein